MSVNLVLDPASVDGTVNYIEQTRQRILDAIRAGMLEAMKGLSAKTVEEFYAAGLKSRTGQLIENIEDSPHVTVKPDEIRGTVAAERDITLGGRRSKHVGLWMEEGTHVPAVPGNLFEFTEPDADTLFSRGHRAFDVKPHPFMNPALQEYETTITDIIQQAVDGALAA